MRLILLTAILIGCGTDENSDNHTAFIDEYSGIYSYWSSEITITCDDGSSDILEPESMNSELIFYENQAMKVKPGENEILYTGIYEVVAEGRSFHVMNIEEFTDETFGRVSATRNLTGIVTDSGSWYGELKVRATLIDFGAICNFENTFEGEKR